MSQITDTRQVAHADANFLAIEQRITELKAQREALIREHYPMTIEMEDELIINGVDSQIDPLEDFIDETAPQALVGAAVKLRRLADRSQLLCSDDLACTSARQVLGLVERLIRAGPSEATIITVPPDDTRILVLFRQWMEARRAYGRQAFDDENEENEDDLDCANDIKREIFGRPAAGMVGLVVKMYLRLHRDATDFRIDDAALAGCDAADLEDREVSSERSLLQDMVRFVPELAALAADFVNLVPSQAPIESLVARPLPRDLTEECRRIRIVSRECHELLEEIWGVRLATNADYREIVREVMARHPGWFGAEAQSMGSHAEEEPVKAKRELTEAERALVKTLNELSYGKPYPPSQPDPRAASNAEDPIWPLTAAQERMAAAIDELQQRSRRRAADAEARLEAHGATVFDADSEIIGFGEPDGRP
jgi:hypothetical protein